MAQPDARDAVHPADAADARAFHAWMVTHCHGKANAKTYQQLRALGCQSTDRQMRTLRHDALNLGLLICADNDGYFVPATRAEAEDMAGRLSSQGREMLRQADRLVALLDVAFPDKRQPRLWGE